jgi:8-oxo-dGTP diphosphatase
MAKVEMINMCMISDMTNKNVLVQERASEWTGISFPGGHIKKGESIVASTMRCIRELTGLVIENLKFCGIIEWCDAETGDRYLVFNFKTQDYTGDLINKPVGRKVYWAKIDDLPHLDLAGGLRECLSMFFDERICEGFSTRISKKRAADLKLCNLGPTVLTTGYWF